MKIHINSHKSQLNVKLIANIVFIFALFLSASLQAKELVFILAGQSNMVGQGTTEELSPYYLQDPHNVSFYYNGYKTSLSRFSHFGPEIGFAHEISRRYPHTKIKLIKFAVGGTSMFAWHPKWNVAHASSTLNASSGSLFEKLIQTAKIPLDGDESVLAGVLWMQGETDAKYPTAANLYGQNLSSFVHALRQELKAPKAPFIMGRVNPPLALFPSSAVVQNAQLSAPGRILDCRLVRTADLSKRSDLLHYNTQGQIELGKRFAQAYLRNPFNINLL